MCGRFGLDMPPKALAEHFQLAESLLLAERQDIRPRFNIAPGQDVACVRAAPHGERFLSLVRWGVVLPGRAAGPTPAPRPASGLVINARAETVAHKPLFRHALSRGRRLVPADCWYEWVPRPKGPPQGHMLRPGQGLFAMAALAVAARDGTAALAVITVPASPDASRIHHRMPAIMPVEAYAAWLAPDTPVDDAAGLLAPWPGGLEVTPLGPAINSTANDSPKVRAPLIVPAQSRLPGL